MDERERLAYKQRIEDLERKYQQRESLRDQRYDLWRADQMERARQRERQTAALIALLIIISGALSVEIIQRAVSRLHGC